MTRKTYCGNLLWQSSLTLLVRDAMGRKVSATDAAGTTATTYNDYGEVVAESTSGLYSRIVSHFRDNYGRDLWLAIGNSRMSIIEYEADTARMKRVKMAGAWFTYYYLPGTDLKSRLQYGGSGSAYYTYEPNRDLLTQVRNHINGGVISQYDYVNDAAGRRTAITRSGSMMSETRTDYYGYNDRSELTNAVKNATLNEYAYQYDDIGNRLSSLDLGTNRTYTANALNQYTNIVEGAGGFLPEFDLDGNQTLVKTSTGVWQVSYNGENRPVLWECGTTNIVMKFDRMGRRVEYIETVSGVTNTHHRFVYDGYLCIQRLNAAANNSIDLVFGWDPSEPVATRPIVLQKYGQYNLFYTHDGNKNVSELVFFQQANGIAAHYEYAPFGTVIATSKNTPVTAYDFREYNPFRFSSEYADDALGLAYYNYRHYEPVMGRWTSRDKDNYIVGNLYLFCTNNSFGQYDILGLVGIDHYASGSPSASNCLGGAMTGRGDCYRYPNNKNPNDSFIDAMHKEGWSCEEVSDTNECRGNKCEDVILITLYKDGANKGKNPWTDKTFKWKLRIDNVYLSDIHAIRRVPGGEEYMQIPSYASVPQEFNHDIDFSLFTNNPLLCCKKERK